MTHGSLFSGIGGFELAARWCGFTNVFSCEIEPFNRRVLHHHFPESELHDDIKEMDATQYYGRVDIISGGFPCQPYSVAGKRLGKDDERHLWPEMLRIIREVAPAYVVGENVRGLVNWSGGLVFEEVCADLEAEGYDVQPFVLPAAGVGAPHRRDRVWFVAHAHHGDDRRAARQNEGESGKERVCERNEVRKSTEPSQVQRDVSNGKDVRCEQTTHIERERREPKQNIRDEVRGTSDADGRGRDVANTDITRLQRREKIRDVERSWQERDKQFARRICSNWKKFPTQPPVCGGHDGLPRELDGITFPKWRAESIKAYGNAIVPQVAYQIFDTIKQMEQ